jgi:hypothetical protein
VCCIYCRARITFSYTVNWQALPTKARASDGPSPLCIYIYTSTTQAYACNKVCQSYGPCTPYCSTSTTVTASHTRYHNNCSHHTCFNHRPHQAPLNNRAVYCCSAALQEHTHCVAHLYMPVRPRSATTCLKQSAMPEKRGLRRLSV